MKKVLIPMVCLTMMFAACADVEVAETGLSSDQLSFSTYMGQSTRASVTTTSNFTNFGVSAYYSTSDKWKDCKESASCNYMNQDIVTGSAEGGWSYDNPKYWPKSGYVNFWAWSPAESENIAWTQGAGVPSFTYTVQDAVGNQEDLVVALAPDQTKGTDGKVSLTFGHLLSKIGFAAKLGGDYTSATVKVTDMQVTYKANTVKKAGVYNYDTEEWTSPESGEQYHANTTNSLLASETTELSNSGSTALNDNGNFLMLLPQSVGADALSAKITYTVTYSDGVETTNVKTVSLPAQAWEAGKQYTYNFTISLNDVKFDVTNVTPWSDAAVVIVDGKPITEFAGAPISVGYTKGATAEFSTTGIASIDDVTSEDYTVTYSNETLTFTAKNENTSNAAISKDISVTVHDILGNQSIITFHLVQAPKIDIFNGGSSIVDQQQTLVYKSTTDLYSVNDAETSSVNYTIAGVSSDSQVEISTNNDFDAAVSGNTLTFAPKASLSAGASDKEATIVVTLKDTEGTKVGDYTFNLKQCAKAYLSANGSAVTSLSQTVQFKSTQALHDGADSYTAVGASSVTGATTGTDFTIGYSSPTLSITANNSLAEAGNSDKEASQTVTLTNAAGEETQYTFGLKQYAAAYITRSGSVCGNTIYSFRTNNGGVTKDFEIVNGTAEFVEWVHQGTSGGVNKKISEHMKTPVVSSNTISISDNSIYMASALSICKGYAVFRTKNAIDEETTYDISVERKGGGSSSDGN